MSKLDARKLKVGTVLITNNKVKGIIIGSRKNYRTIWWEYQQRYPSMSPNIGHNELSWLHRWFNKDVLSIYCE